MCHLARLSFAFANCAARHNHDKVDQGLLALPNSLEQIESRPNTQCAGARRYAPGVYDFDPLEPLKA